MSEYTQDDLTELLERFVEAAESIAADVQLLTAVAVKAAEGDDD